MPFIESIPGYSVVIALLSRDGTLYIGVVYDPVAPMLYRAVKGQANESVKGSPSTEQALIFISDNSFSKDALYQIVLVELEHIANDLGYARAEMVLQGGAAMNTYQVLNRAPVRYFKFPIPQ